MTNWQTRAAEFAQKYALVHDPGVHTLDLISECGEVAKELLLATDYGHHAPYYTPELEGELGDVLYSLCVLATAVNVDLEAAFKATLAKYEHRLQDRGHVGSRTR